jgi:hypothetical protein
LNSTGSQSIINRTIVLPLAPLLLVYGKKTCELEVVCDQNSAYGNIRLRPVILGRANCAICRLARVFVSTQYRVDLGDYLSDEG